MEGENKRGDGGGGGCVGSGLRPVSRNQKIQVNFQKNIEVFSPKMFTKLSYIYRGSEGKPIPDARGL